MFFNKRNKKAVEGYHDITPYDFHWDMFKCLDMDCLKNKTKKCYDWCNNWGESGGRHNCRMRCLDYADQYAEQLKFNNYNFNRILPKFKWAALHRDKWYNWRKFSQ
jgi:hypothetical protein